jgi:hypothetical protein
MLSREEKIAVLQQLTYSDSRKVKESRRGKKFVITKALFLQSFLGKNVQVKNKILTDFLKIKDTAIANKMPNIADQEKTMQDVKFNPISPNLIA